MKEQLEQLYGEYYHLEKTCHDWLLAKEYNAKMDAIITLLKPMSYGAANPIKELL